MSDRNGTYNGSDGKGRKRVGDAVAVQTPKGERTRFFNPNSSAKGQQTLRRDARRHAGQAARQQPTSEELAMIAAMKNLNR